MTLDEVIIGQYPLSIGNLDQEVDSEKVADFCDSDDDDVSDATHLMSIDEQGAVKDSSSSAVRPCSVTVLPCTHLLISIFMLLVYFCTFYDDLSSRYVLGLEQF